MIDCLRKIVQNEGTVPALVRQTTYTSIVMVCFPKVKTAIARDPAAPTFFDRLMSGGIAGAIGISFVNPVEVAKTQLQTSTAAASASASAAPKPTMAGVMRSVYAAEGIRGLWAGWTPNVARCFLVNAAEIGTYDQVKHMLIENEVFSFSPLLQHVTASATAGFASACTSTPADVVKTRLMNQTGKETTGQVYTGIADAVTTIVKTEGLATLWSGFAPILTRKVIWCTVFFVSAFVEEHVEVFATGAGADFLGSGAIAEEEAEAEAEEPPQVVRVGRMSFEGVWYLVDKGNGVVYANDIQNPEVVGTYSEAGGISLDDSEEEEDSEDGEDGADDAEAAAEAAGTAAAPDGTCEDGEVDGDGKCGCGALKRAPGSVASGGPQIDMSSIQGDNEERVVAALVELEGGFFPEDGEGPAREVTVGPFRIGQHEVSNERFAAFVKSTGYVTEAERFGVQNRVGKNYLGRCCC
eukprot:gene8356-12381_t